MTPAHSSDPHPVGLRLVRRANPAIIDVTVDHAPPGAARPAGVSAADRERLALALLVDGISNDPGHLLQTLVDVVTGVFGVGTAAVALTDGSALRWDAAAGPMADSPRWTAFHGTIVARHVAELQARLRDDAAPCDRRRLPSRTSRTPRRFPCSTAARPSACCGSPHGPAAPRSHPTTCARCASWPSWRRRDGSAGRTANRHACRPPQERVPGDGQSRVAQSAQHDRGGRRAAENGCAGPRRSRRDRTAVSVHVAPGHRPLRHRPCRPSASWTCS